jgi:hypothetical protein
MAQDQITRETFDALIAHLKVRNVEPFTCLGCGKKYYAWVGQHGFVHAPQGVLLMKEGRPLEHYRSCAFHTPSDLIVQAIILTRMN